jgi:lauroyl/myristoyl acyltransferase
MRARVALARAATRGRRTWRDPAVRAAARASAEAIAGPGPRVDRIARRHLATSAAREALIHRPEIQALVRLLGTEHLDSARASGRGVIVSHVHWGPFPGYSGTLASLVPGMPIVVGSWLLIDQPDPVAGPRQRAWRANLERSGARLIGADGSYDELERLLRAGETTFIAFDLPGRHETRFLGRPAMLASGSARLASATDALVVPGERRMHRGLPVQEFFPALDPRDHAGWQGLHQALADLYSARVRTDPAWLEDPRRGGAWEDGATADGWRLPQPAERADAGDP